MLYCLHDHQARPDGVQGACKRLQPVVKAYRENPSALCREGYRGTIYSEGDDACGLLTFQLYAQNTTVVAYPQEVEDDMEVARVPVDEEAAVLSVQVNKSGAET